MNRVWYLCVVLVTAVLVAGCGSSGRGAEPAASGKARDPRSGDIPGGAVAVVDGQRISRATFEKWLTFGIAHRLAEQYPKGPVKPMVVLPGPPRYSACLTVLRELEAAGGSEATHNSAATSRSLCARDYDDGKYEAMNYLISEVWLRGEAKARGVAVSEHEAQAALGKLRSEYKPGELKRILVRTGQTEADALARLRLELLAKKLEARALGAAKTAPSKAEVAHYYGTHKSNYGHPEERDMRVIVTKTKAEAVQARKELEAGTSFAAVAGKFARYANLRKDGGVANGITNAAHSGNLIPPIFAAKVGVLTGPVKTKYGYELFEVTKIIKPLQKPLAAVETQVRAEVHAELEGEAKRRYQEDLESKWKPKTKCLREDTIDLCGNYKPPAATTTTSTSTTTSSSRVESKK